MKSRWTTCLLLAAVVAVWGVVAWRILAPARPAAPDVRPATDAPAVPQIVAETLRLDYPDPFLKGVAAPTPAARSVVRRLPPAGKAEPKRREPWGLYELLHITTADSLVASSRIVGAEPDPARTLFYADDRTAVTLAGDTRLHGTLRLPQNGLTYGRVGAEFYRGEEVPRTAIRSSARRLPAPSSAAAARIGALFAFAQQLPAAGDLPDSLGVSFRDPTVVLRLGTAEIGGCTLRGRIVLAADELRIDSACRLENVLVCARKITVGSGARIAAQLFARDTVVVEPCAVLEYPSGIYAGRYAELGDRATADGYVIVRDTVRHKKMAASYRQSRTARVRGLLHADGAAQVQGIVAGCAELRQAVYFSPQGYYKDMLYDVTLLENSATAQPLWHGGAEAVRRKEAVCVE